MLVLSRLARAGLSRLSALSALLEPFRLQRQPADTIPRLHLKSEAQLLENWWSESPFQTDSAAPLAVPVFSIEQGQFLERQVGLPQDIFNVPLRRDLIYRLYDFRIKLDRFSTKMTRNRAMTHGSGRKVRKQKGQGVARMGDKRAPHLYKGGKAHGAKPRVFSYPLNAKVKLQALKALLSAKLAEGRLKIVDSEALSAPKTKLVAKIFESHLSDQRALLCVITSRDCDPNFEMAQRNMPRVLWHDSHSLDVLSLFKADKILVTEKGLQELIDNIYKTTYVAYRHPSMPLPSSGSGEAAGEEEFDPSQPYEFKFRILGEYLQKYERAKRQQPQLLQRQKFKTRRHENLL